jgi:hypothetical protein
MQSLTRSRGVGAKRGEQACFARSIGHPLPHSSALGWSSWADPATNRVDSPISDPLHGHDFGSVRVSADPATASSPLAQKASTRSEVHRHQFAAIIHDNNVSDEKGGSQQETAMPSGDAVPRPSANEIPELEEGQTVQLPDVIMVEELAIGQSDAIVNQLTYNAAISQAGTVDPGDFGTTSFLPSLSNIKVTRVAKPKSFAVTATVDDAITFQVRDAVGPNGEVNIDSETDSDITAANYSTVVSDLTPDKSDLNGRPPRTKFWAKNLSLVHEKFHATDGSGFGRLGVEAAQTTLANQTATTVAEVQGLVAKIPGQVQKVRHDRFIPGAESRAYGDGASKYQALANAVKSRGDGGKYP